MKSTFSKGDFTELELPFLYYCGVCLLQQTVFPILLCDSEPERITKKASSWSKSILATAENNGDHLLLLMELGKFRMES